MGVVDMADLLCHALPHPLQDPDIPARIADGVLNGGYPASGALPISFGGILTPFIDSGPILIAMSDRSSSFRHSGRTPRIAGRASVDRR
jgi:hypothetical protein